ncbi:GTPase-activating protein [Saccharomycopsis crataegensis]|uniref:ADP-ribosylation factor GTPase-activating protein n=1 Tax=Saccharomycopsis crataegensis TaxID=43959 RepID=A0AAV5QVR8_9ASCO|nr:GTPase-activating protein [Saccharomycopsis crataegensis]
MGQILSLSESKNHSLCPIILEDSIKLNLHSVTITRTNNNHINKALKKTSGHSLTQEDEDIPDVIKIENINNFLTINSFKNKEKPFNTNIKENKKGSSDEHNSLCKYIQNPNVIDFEFPFLLQLNSNSNINFTVESDGKYIDEINSRNEYLSNQRQSGAEKEDQNRFYNDESDDDSDDEKFNDAIEYNSIHKDSFVADDGELIDEKPQPKSDRSQQEGKAQQFENISTVSKNKDDAETQSFESDDEDEFRHLIFKKLCLIRGHSLNDIYEKLDQLKYKNLDHTLNTGSSYLSENSFENDPDIEIIGDVYKDDDDEEESETAEANEKRESVNHNHTKTPKFRFSFNYEIPRSSDGNYIYKIFYQDININSEEVYGDFKPLMEFSVWINEEDDKKKALPGAVESHSQHSSPILKSSSAVFQQNNSSSTSNQIASSRASSRIPSFNSRIPSVSSLSGVLSNTLSDKKKKISIENLMLKRKSSKSMLPVTKRNLELLNKGSSSPLASGSADLTKINRDDNQPVASSPLFRNKNNNKIIIVGDSTSLREPLTSPTDTFHTDTMTVQYKESDFKSNILDDSETPTSPTNEQFSGPSVDVITSSGLSAARSRRKSLNLSLGKKKRNSFFGGISIRDKFGNGEDGGEESLEITDGNIGIPREESTFIDDEGDYDVQIQDIKRTKSTRSMKSNISSKSLTKTGKNALRKLKKSFSMKRLGAKDETANPGDIDGDVRKDNIKKTESSVSLISYANTNASVNAAQSIHSSDAEEDSKSQFEDDTVEILQEKKVNYEPYFMESNDGPEFRNVLDDMENYIMNFKPVLRDYFKKTECYLSSNIEANNNRKEYVDTLAALKKFLIKNDSGGYDQDLNECINDMLKRLQLEIEFCEQYNKAGVLNLLNSMRKLSSDYEGNMVTGGGDSEMSQVDTSVSKEFEDDIFDKKFTLQKKKYNDKSKEYYNWLNKYLANDRSLISKLPKIGSNNNANSSNQGEVKSFAGDDSTLNDYSDDESIIINSGSAVGNSTNKRLSFSSKRNSIGGDKFQAANNIGSIVSNSDATAKSNSTENKDLKYLKRKKSFELARLDYFNYLNNYKNGNLIETMKINILKLINDVNHLELNHKHKQQQISQNDSIMEINNRVQKLDFQWQDVESKKKLQRHLIMNAKNNSEMIDALNILSKGSIENPASVADVDSTVAGTNPSPVLPDHKGILWTYGGGNRSGWHKQWVVLEDGYLREYVDWKKGKVIRGPPLDIRFGCIKPSVSSSDRRFCFEIITTKNEKRLFQASSQQDRDTWVSSVNECLNLSVNSTHLEQLTHQIGAQVEGSEKNFLNANATRNPSTNKQKNIIDLPPSSSAPSPPGDSNINKNNTSMFGRGSRSFKKSTTQGFTGAGVNEFSGHNSDIISNNMNNSIGNNYQSNYNSMSINQINSQYAAATNQSSDESQLNYLEIVRRSHKSNVVCADCGSTKSVDWISISLLVVVCIDCSGVHRSLGSHLSKIRSLTLDISIFTPEIVKLLHSVSNEQANSYLEKKLKGDKSALISPGSSSNERSSFIVNKYKEKSFIEEDPKVNSHLIYGIHSNNVHLILKSLACGGNPNMVVIKGKEKEVESSLLEYALTHYSGTSSNPIFEIAELLLLNGASCGNEVKDNLNLIKPAKNFWQAKIDRSLGISSTSSIPATGSSGHMNTNSMSSSYFNSDQNNNNDDFLDSSHHITNGLSFKKEKKGKKSNGIHSYSYSDLNGGNSQVANGDSSTKKNFSSQIPLFSFSRSSKKKNLG